MACKTIDEIVLRTMRLVSDYDDVFTLGQGRIFPTFCFREEFLDGCKHNSPGCYRQEFLQILTIPSLNRFLSQEFMTPGECAEQLVIEIVPIGDHHNSRV